MLSTLWLWLRRWRVVYLVGNGRITLGVASFCFCYALVLLSDVRTMKYWAIFACFIDFFIHVGMCTARNALKRFKQKWWNYQTKSQGIPYHFLNHSSWKLRFVMATMRLPTSFFKPVVICLFLSWFIYRLYDNCRGTCGTCIQLMLHFNTISEVETISSSRHVLLRRCWMLFTHFVTCSSPHLVIIHIKCTE